MFRDVPSECSITPREIVMKAPPTHVSVYRHPKHVRNIDHASSLTIPSHLVQRPDCILSSSHKPFPWSFPKYLINESHNCVSLCVTLLTTSHQLCHCHHRCHYTHAHTHTHMHTHIHTYTYAHTHMHMHIHALSPSSLMDWNTLIHSSVL